MKNNKISFRVSEYWYHQFLIAFQRIKPYGVYTIFTRGQEKAPDYVIEYRFDDEISNFNHSHIAKIIIDEFPVEMRLEDITGIEYINIGKTYEPKNICKLDDVYFARISVPETKLNETSIIIENNIRVIEEVMVLHPGKRSNTRLVLQSVKLLHEYIRHNIECCRIVNDEVFITATYKGLEKLSVLMEAYIGDNSTIFRNLTNAKKAGLIAISSISNAKNGTVWKISKFNLKDINNKMQKNFGKESAGAKIGRTSYSQIKITMGKDISDDIYIVKNKYRQINKIDIIRLSRKIIELKINEVIFEQDIMESLNDSDKWIFVNCRATICSGLMLRRVRYSEAKIEIGTIFKKHGNSIVYIA